MTTTGELTAFVKPRLGREFAGVFASDRLPNKLAKPCSLIVNYSPADQPGTHWVAMSFPRGRNAQFFSSFGLGPDQADAVLHTRTGFRSYLESHSDTGDWEMNSEDLQSLEDDTCGEWSAYFCLHGQPSKTSAAWAPLLALQNAAARDRKIRQLVPVRDN